MSEFEKQLDAAIENYAHEYLIFDPDLNCDYSFKAGANLLKPLLMKAIESRNDYIRLCEHFERPHQKESEIRMNDMEMLEMMGDL